MARHPKAPRIVIASPPRIALPNITHLWEAREVLIRFGARDITLRYRQTALGVVWVILQPLLTALIFALVFGKIAHLSTGGVPYLVFSFAGLLAWNMFNAIITRGSGALLQNSALVSKVFFPRVLVPLSTVFSTLVDFGVSLTFMAMLLIVNGIAPGWPLALLPIWVLLLVLLASGLATVLSGLAVSYRDVQYVVPFLLQFLLYASPVAYALDAVPSKYHIIYEINPLTWLLQEFRWSLLDRGAPPAWQIGASVGVCVGVFLLCMLWFEQMERGLADVI